MLAVSDSEMEIHVKVASTVPVHFCSRKTSKIRGKTRLKDIVGFVSGAKMRISKDGRAEGPQRSGTDTLEVLLLKTNEKDEHEISRPKKKEISRLLRRPSKCCGTQ